MQLLEGLYTLTSHRESGENKEWQIRLADAAHPVFRAHFENNPILPGFIQIEIASQLTQKSVTAVSKARFLAPVLPKDELLLILKDPKTGRFELKRGEASLSEFAFE